MNRVMRYDALSGEEIAAFAFAPNERHLALADDSPDSNGIKVLWAFTGRADDCVTDLLVSGTNRCLGH